MAEVAADLVEEAAVAGVGSEAVREVALAADLEEELAIVQAEWEVVDLVVSGVVLWAVAFPAEVEPAGRVPRD